MKRLIWLATFLSLLVVLAPAPARADGTCGNPDNWDTCSTLCSSTATCMACCDTHFDNVTGRGWFAWLRRIIHYGELSSCRGHCATDLNGTIGSGKIVLIDPLERVPVGSYVVGEVTRPGKEGRLVTVDTQLSGVVEIWVRKNGPLAQSGELEIRGGRGESLTLRVGLTGPQLRLVTSSSDQILLEENETELTDVARNKFAAIVAKMSPEFNEQLNALIELGALDDAYVKDAAMALRDLAGRGRMP